MPRIDVVATDLIPEYLNAVSVDIFRLWRQFALGQTHLGGRSIAYPSGRYAASISMHRYGTRVTTVRSGREYHTRQISHIAIIADERLAPEAHLLEYGHKPIDMLEHLDPGRRYPMHRSGGYVPTHVRAGARNFPTSASGRARIRSMWSEIRQLRSTGSARTPDDPSERGDMNTSRTGPAWTIPAMPAYEPAHLLAELFASAKGLSITVS